MSYLNVSSATNFVKLLITSDSGVTLSTAVATTTNVLSVPALQDITVTNNNGTFRWVQLDSQSRKVVATPATNSLNINIVLDDAAFFTGSGTTKGIFDLSNEKTLVYFKMLWGGGSSKYITGQGYLTGLAPKVNPDQPVWITPVVLEVDGNFTASA
jgi:hypothetical protein